MKLLLTLLLTFIGIVVQAQHSKEITAIEFVKETRGYQEQIRVTKDSIISSVNNVRLESGMKSNAKKNTNKKWKSLVNALRPLEPKDVAKLKSPSDERARDAAMHSTITIRLQTGERFSHTFDDDKPHRDLNALLHCLKEIAK